ncbi:alpha/beta fold hydrolase [Nocardioides sp. CF8]|uniref:alpha/beta fold hydrolase n=1 Tax=Nocardioides sp. CF8 TaxID=110319 RepID=UPI0018DCAC67|nr:alpha/beta fold hydrolase [Nocardioides sp. CF8]
MIFLSNPLADPVDWSSNARDRLLALGYQVTTFEHRPTGLDWRSVVKCVSEFILRRGEPVALVGWSQGAAIAQEAALAVEGRVTCAALLATDGRQNEVDKTLQQCWDLLADGSDDLDCLRFAMGLLTAFPPTRLADDEFVRNMRTVQRQWAGRPDREARRRSAAFISTYQDRLPDLAGLRNPCLVVGFELDTDALVARAREGAA